MRPFLSILVGLCLAWTPRVHAGEASAGQLPADAARSQALVQQLGDQEFATRERATSDLIQLGPPARAALLEGKQHPDREIRFRCERILDIIEELDFERRLAAFAAGRDDEHQLPGWARFLETFGGGAAARSLFVEMQKSDSDVMRAVGDGPQEVSRAIQTRCVQLQQRQRLGRQLIPLGSIAALLFAAGDEQVNLPAEAGSAIGSFCYQQEIAGAVADPERGPIVKRLLGDWVKRADGWAAYQNLALAMRYDLKEGLVPALKVVENQGNQPFVRQQGILAIAKLGDESHFPKLEALLDDSALCASQRLANVTYNTQVRDVALAALVLMSKQDPKKFGFDRLQLNEQMGFTTGTAGFENDDQRNAARQKWVEFKTRRSSPTGEPAAQATP